MLRRNYLTSERSKVATMKNIDKILYYLTPLAKDTIVVDNKEIPIQRSSLKLSPTFFYKDTCISCGRCCGSVPEKIILTELEYQYMQSYSEQDFIDYKLNPEVLKLLKETMKPEIHTINGKEITIYKTTQPIQTIYLETKEKEVLTCHFLFKYAEGQYRCGIHPVRSITCRFPHTAIYSNHHGISIGVKQYGRNWKLGCPTQF